MENDDRRSTNGCNTTTSAATGSTTFLNSPTMKTTPKKFFEAPAPTPGTKRYIRILKAGCGGHRDYWGEFDCLHRYEWECGDCPIVVNTIDDSSISDEPEYFVFEVSDEHTNRQDNPGSETNV